MRTGVSFETRRSTSLCSCRFNSPLRVVCLACCAAVCLFVGVVAAPRAAAPPWPGLGCSFVLLFGSRSTVGLTHVTSGWNQLKGAPRYPRSTPLIGPATLGWYAKNPNLQHEPTLLTPCTPKRYGPVVGVSVRDPGSSRHMTAPRFDSRRGHFCTRRARRARGKHALRLSSWASVFLLCPLPLGWPSPVSSPVQARW
jgi:hypothetical protein